METVRSPKYIRENARRALRYIEDGSKAMLPIGRRRARQLAEGKPLGRVTLEKMYRFKRHQNNASYIGDPSRDRGAVAWLGWGNSLRQGKGVPDASEWARRQLNRIDKVSQSNRKK